MNKSFTLGDLFLMKILSRDNKNILIVSLQLLVCISSFPVGVSCILFLNIKNINQ